jgi:hypothetical protein
MSHAPLGAVRETVGRKPRSMIPQCPSVFPKELKQMAQKAEYKVIQASNTNQLGVELSGAAKQGWCPILMSAASIPAGVVITVILEHVLGS